MYSLHCERPASGLRAGAVAVLHCTQARRVLPAMLAATVVVLVVLSPAAGVKKPIIIFMRAFQPAGEINGQGTLLKLWGKGTDAAVGETGERLHVLITVVQPQTGARAVGQVQSIHGVGHPPHNSFILAHRVPRSPRFQPGPVRASAVATRLNGNQVISTWSWTSNIVLVQK
jgi:hypothetical protein